MSISRLIITIIVLGLVIGAGKIIGDSYRVGIHDRIAVSQLEDSDENLVALNASTRMVRYMRGIQFVIVLIALWIIWGKYLKTKGKYLKTKYKEITEEPDEEG